MEFSNNLVNEWRNDSGPCLHGQIILQVVDTL